MEYEVIDSNNKKCKVVAETENAEAVALVIKAMEIMSEIKEEYEPRKVEYEDARYKLEKMFGKGFKEFGLKSVKSPYLNITYVPASEGTTKVEKVLNEKKLAEDLESLGLSIDDYYIRSEKKVGARKESIKVTE